jgi:hypothetical protein
VPGHERPEFRWQENDDRIVMSAAGLAMIFDRAGDRWTHRLEIGEPALGVNAKALEGDGGQDSPARITSPLYQEIHRHELAARTGLCCLLTGLLFQHHFSAVITLVADTARPEMLLLEFDVADRCRRPVETLAATYVLTIDSSALADADPHKIVWTGGKLGHGRLELIVPPPASVALAEAGRQATRVQAVALVEPARFTHRLIYRWRWTSASSLTR